MLDRRPQRGQPLGVIDRGGGVMNRARSDQAEQALVGAAQDLADGPARIDDRLRDGLVDAQFFLEHPRSDQLPGRNYV